MSKLLQHPAKIVRAIHVERVRPNVDIWQATFPGDEWTGEMTFEPPMPWDRLRNELQHCPRRCGLPIVRFCDMVGEVAA